MDEQHFDYFPPTNAPAYSNVHDISPNNNPPQTRNPPLPQIPSQHITITQRSNGRQLVRISSTRNKEEKRPRSPENNRPTLCKRAGFCSRGLERRRAGGGSHARTHSPRVRRFPSSVADNERSPTACGREDGISRGKNRPRVRRTLTGYLFEIYRIMFIAREFFRFPGCPLLPAFDGFFLR